MAYTYRTMQSPVGALTLVASQNALAAILWENDDPLRVRLGAMLEDRKHELLSRTEQELQEYFAGERQAFSVPLEFTGTVFQKKVWRALTTIPYGETRSYGQIAAQIGHPSASRAVGAANGKTPSQSIAPCHRVIGTNGKLTGFAGGLAAKELLLKLERKETDSLFELKDR
ncbi:methylated-DNA--[protein]-cysteine S-methyltransferase [Oscillatoria laete-virens NRMC-F 0139]|nr:methylated-DNA--[protein]-cysteine S-methyltransferase [Oscillatoria laete-virens]MDL5051999.1 methylated-DNA--[protein]-cysteine S-methyltransferase [Oscillatoria laete-virens NRMC-F 0139]